MSTSLKYLLLALRLALGWIFLYAGLEKLLDPDWSPAGFLKGASTWPELFQWLAEPQNIQWVTELNQWGLTLIGLGLILGLLTRLTAGSGLLLMILYYLPGLSFPFVGEHSFLVDEHIIYALLLLVLIVSRAGSFFGLDAYIFKKKASSALN